jgi:hypothetical protein
MNYLWLSSGALALGPNNNNKKILAYIMQEQEGATLLVSAKFTLVSARNIYLQFQEVIILICMNMFITLVEI